MRRSNMRSRRYGAWTAAMLLVLSVSGCSLETDDDGIRIQPVFQESDNPAPDPDVPPNVSLQVSAAGVVLTSGDLVATCATGRLDARVERTASNIKVRVIYVAPAGCTAAPTLVNYDILLSNIPQGNYHFSVVHEGDRQVPTGTVVAEEDLSV